MKKAPATPGKRAPPDDEEHVREGGPRQMRMFVCPTRDRLGEADPRSPTHTLWRKLTSMFRKFESRCGVTRSMSRLRWPSIAAIAPRLMPRLMALGVPKLVGMDGWWTIAPRHEISRLMRRTLACLGPCDRFWSASLRNLHRCPCLGFIT